MSFSAIQDAIDRIQSAYRPSVTRMGLNHGNIHEHPDLFKLDERVARQRDDLAKIEKEFEAAQNSGPSVKKEILARMEEEKDKLRGLEAAQTELRRDYDLAQAFRDDPRALTQACSLILALLEKDCGRLCLALALTTYRDILLRYAEETFQVGETWRPKISTDRFEAERESLVYQVLYASGLSAHGPGLEVLAHDIDATALRDELYDITFRGLSRTLERFRFPILNRLNGLKLLADAIILKTWGDVDQKGSGDRSASIRAKGQIGRLIRDMTSTSDIYGSEMHFPSHRIGATMALCFIFMRRFDLHTLLDDEVAEEPTKSEQRYAYYQNDKQAGRDDNAKPLLSDVITTREAVGEFAVSRLDRSQESYSMGKAYYENISYMHYLNDDFNDRSVHFYHASGMANADTAEILSLLVREGLKKKY